MIETLIVCITFLIALGGSIWFLKKLILSKADAVQLRQELIDTTERFKTLLLADVQVLANNQLKLEDRLKKLDVAASMSGGPGKSLLEKIQEQTASRRKPLL